jgi:short-subunit dehydrogenase
MNSNSDKHVLLTGGTSGIGYELAKLFAKDGYQLTIVARTEADLIRVADELQALGAAGVTPIAQDLMTPDGPFQLCQEVTRPVDILVNDAGQGAWGEFLDIDIERELGIIRLNIDAYVILTKHFLKEMVARGSGKVLNVASVAGKVPGPLQAVYHATKAFILSWSEAVKFEIRDVKGVTITDLMPGATDTDFFHKAGMEQAVVVQEDKLAPAADVAKDGYEALMKGEDRIISGFMNKVNITLSNVMPDSVAAAQTYKDNKPADETKS